MTDTPTETTAKRRNGYLPVLPDGWSYSVNIQGSGGQVRVVQERGDEPALLLITPSDEKQRVVQVEDLPSGIKAGVEAARALDRLAKVESEYRSARARVLEALDDKDEDDEPTDVPPPGVGDETPAGDLAKDDTPAGVGG